MAQNIKKEKSGKYDDIVDLPHHVSQNRPKMPMIDRAAQFSPFAALVGYEAAVEETARLTDDKIELTEESKHRISDKLLRISENADSEINVRITHFVPDEKKEGGAYVKTEGTVRYIDEYEREVVLSGKRTISIDQIWDVEIL